MYANALGISNAGLQHYIRRTTLGTLGCILELVIPPPQLVVDAYVPRWCKQCDAFLFNTTHLMIGKNNATTNKILTLTDRGMAIE